MTPHTFSPNAVRPGRSKRIAAKLYESLRQTVPDVSDTDRLTPEEVNRLQFLKWEVRHGLYSEYPGKNHVRVVAHRNRLVKSGHHFDEL